MDPKEKKVKEEELNLSLIHISQRKTLRLYAELHPYLRFLEHRRRSD